MNGISHKQAVQWIHRRLDNLLDESQLSSLEEHLHSCEFCRTYAAELDSLPAQLQSKFHSRWDERQPSRRAMQYVTTRARKIHISNRISSGVTLFAGAVALIVLAVAINFVISRLQSTSSATNLTETVDPSPRAEDRLLAFASDQNGNADVYTMHADGSGLTNLTKSPASDTNPVWSPDGTRIAFESDRNGFKQIYVMDADGSDLIQVTRDEANHQLPFNFNDSYHAWSPDGSRLVFTQESATAATLYVIDINGENKIALEDGNISPYEVSWSPDGTYIGYVRNNSPTPDQTYVPDIYVINSDGSNRRELKALLPEGEYLDALYYWSSGGRSIIFTAFENNPLRQTVYKLDLETNTFLRENEVKPHLMDWTEDVQLITDVHQEGFPMVWERSDGTTHTFEESKAWGELCSLDFTRSPGHNYAIGVYCPYNKFNLYWTNSDGSSIKQLLTLPIDLITGGTGDITWSPDDQYVAFNITSPGKTDMYVLKVAEFLANPSSQPLHVPVSNEESRSTIPSWQPVMTEDIAREESTPRPISSSGDLLAFTSDQNGNFDIYTIRPDGTGIANITSHPARDTDPVWSPDGRRIAFQSDRDGFMQIYLMNPDGSNVVQLTTDETDHALMHYMNEFSAWSPDGTRLLISGGLPGEEKWQLYILDVNEGRKSLLIEKPNTLSASAISWSPDGQHIALLSTNPERYESHIYMVNADGSDLREITEPFPANETVFTSDYHWSPDARSFFFVAMFQKSNSWTAYEARLDDDSLIELATTKDLMFGWWNGTYLVNNSSASAPFEWVRPDGTSSKLNPTEECEHIDLYQSDSTVKRSPNGNWVVTGQCANGDTWLYWANSDGTQIQRLLDLPIALTDRFLIPVSWSDDDRFVAFSTNSLSDLGDMYILNVSEALTDHSIQPVKLPDSALPSWRPVGDENIVRETPMSQPTSTSASRGLIAFTAAGENGEPDIFTVLSDGSGPSNITTHLAKDTNPTWSPDGQRIAFVSDRDGDHNIYIMNADGSELIQVTDGPVPEFGPVWSPDGTKIAYLSGDFSKKDLSISVMDSDGQNHRRLNSHLYIPNPGWPAAWTSDSQFIVFYYGSDVVQDAENSNASAEMGRFFVKVGIYAAGFGNPTGAFTTYDQDMLGSFALSQDGSKLFYLAECDQSSAEFCATVKTIHENNPNPEIHATVTVDDICPVEQTSTWRGQAIKWSPDRTKILFLFTCEEEGWIYIASADGSDFKPLTNYPILGNGPENEVATADWSPDSQSIVFMSALETSKHENLYILNVNEALQNPKLLPSPLNISASQISSPVWQPTP